MNEQDIVRKNEQVFPDEIIEAWQEVGRVHQRIHDRLVSRNRN